MVALLLPTSPLRMLRLTAAPDWLEVLDRLILEVVTVSGQPEDFLRIEQNFLTFMHSRGAKHDASIYEALEVVFRLSGKEGLRTLLTQAL